MTTRAFDFRSPAGYSLSGRLELPDTQIRAWAIVAHCFTCGKDGRTAFRIARALAKTGIATLRFDFAGLGNSGGSFADDTFAADVRDLVAAGEAMSAAGMPPSLLIGHSLGGAASLAAAASMPGVKVVTTIGAPYDVTHVLRQFSPSALQEIEERGEAEVILAGRPFVVRKSFVEDLRRHDPAVYIGAIRQPLLVMHAPGDATVGIDHAGRIFMAAKHPKSFISLDDADHLLTQQADVDYAVSIIADWSMRYLDLPTPEAEDTGQENGIVAEETGSGHLQVSIQAGRHAFLADESAGKGGLGSGPSPYDLLSAGLAACTTMTLRLYADHKGWPVHHIRTAVSHAKPLEPHGKDKFVRSISIRGLIDESQRARLLEIANHCPVDLTLVGGSEVETTLT